MNSRHPDTQIGGAPDARVPATEPGRRAAVLGSPIAHSLSPVLHGAAYRALDLAGWRYDRFECTEDGLPGFVAELGPEWAGLSLTMPLKRVALQVADDVSPAARAIGAANTLIRLPAGGWRAENTDVAGMVAALREAGLVQAGSAVILGAGGTAQATVWALAALGVTELTVLVRDPARTAELSMAAEPTGLVPTVLGGLGRRPLPAADLVISTLPRGAADPYADAGLDPRTVLLDVVYDPWPTAIAAAAQARGCTVVSGLAMLLHQAVEQVTLMTGRPGPVEPMRAALAAEVASRG